ncbi:MAG: hypothetical protein CMI18_13205 [Opitutaceae bacterium]|nr:hypothetical protein [Opitutaceae bacterium]|tara:strand:- start:834 stop:1691 length:858 start_codon:yes stop_codon:yes gene_type:complete
MSEVMIRKMREGDISAVMHLKNAEGWNQTEDDWKFLLNHDPELCLIASYNHKVVGSVTAISYENHIVWIGMMLVDYDHRKRGIGNKLFRELLELLQGCRVIKLDASPAGNPIYRKFGFIEELQLQRLIANQVQQSGSVNTDCQVRPIQDSDLEMVVEIDRKILGVKRKELMHFLFQVRGAGGYLAVRDNSVMGILGTRQGSLYKQIGPVYAESKEAAMALVSTALSNVSGSPVTLDIHSANTEFRDWLYEMGFEPQRPFHRMFLEKNPDPGRVDLLYAISSPELG